MSLFSLFKRSSETVDSAHFKYQPAIELEHQLSEQIYNALQGPIVEEVLHKIANDSSDNWWRSNMEGNSLKVEADLLPDFYQLCQEVKQRLGYEGKVDFYITADSTINAFSVATEGEDEPDIVNLNSELFNMMSTDELRFVVGHELGHLINHDSALSRLIHFIFPAESTNAPVTLQYKIRLHDQLAELVADRYGYIAAAGNLAACITAFYKMASGLDLAKLNVSIDALIANNTKRLSYFLSDKGVSRSTHPVNPIRVEALNLYANAASQKQLDEKMDELISILLKVGDGERDEYIARFIASAGLIVANADGDITKEEIDTVIEELANVKIFPRKFLDEIAQGEVGEIFQEAVGKLLNLDPSLRDGLMGFMIQIVMSDQNIDEKEVKLLYDFGEMIGMNDKEVAQNIAASIQHHFVPSLDAIC